MDVFRMCMPRANLLHASMVSPFRRVRPENEKGSVPVVSSRTRMSSCPCLPRCLAAMFRKEDIGLSGDCINDDHSGPYRAERRVALERAGEFIHGIAPPNALAKLSA